MGPLQYGVMQFELESNPPDHTKIPADDLIGVTAIILSILYKGQEFFRIGYYVYNSYTDPELMENPPQEIPIDKVLRNILADKPRVTRFDIKWGFEDEKVQEMKIQEFGTMSEGVLKENIMETNKLEGSNAHLLFMMNDKAMAGVAETSIGFQMASNLFYNPGITENSVASNTFGQIGTNEFIGTTTEVKNPFL